MPRSTPLRARHLLALSLGLSLSLISACGGGGGGSSSPVAPAPWVGTRQFGVAGANTLGTAVARDARGNIYVAGTTYGGLDGNTLMGLSDFFLTKFDPSGKKLFTRQLGVAGVATYGTAVATDASGHVYVVGETWGGLDGNTQTGTGDCFLTKFDPSGKKLFTRQLGVADLPTGGRAVATDASGNIYVAGYTVGGLDGNTLAGVADFFVTKYDPKGKKLFTRQLGAAGAHTAGNAVATDASGNVYVAGRTYGGLDGNTLMGFTDFFLTKFDANGNRLFTRQLGVYHTETLARAVATDASGHVYVTGLTTGGLDGNYQRGSNDVFLTKYDDSGTRLYTRQFGEGGPFSPVTVGNAVATDGSGHVYVVGMTTGRLDGNDRMGMSDFFLIQYDSNGDRHFTRQLGVAGTETEGNAVTTDASGHAYVVGTTAGGLDGNTRMGMSDFFLIQYDSSGVKQ